MGKPKLEFTGEVPAGMHVYRGSNRYSLTDMIKYEGRLREVFELISELESRVPEGYLATTSVVLPTGESQRFKVFVSCVEAKGAAEVVMPHLPPTPTTAAEVEQMFPMGTRVHDEENRKGVAGVVIGYRQSRFKATKEKMFLLVERYSTGTAYMMEPEKAVIDGE